MPPVWMLWQSMTQDERESWLAWEKIFGPTRRSTA